MKFNSIAIAVLQTAFLLLFSSNNTIAQDNAADSAFYQQALSNTMNVYHQAFGNQSALYNGSKYGEYLYRFTDSHPYFNLAEFATGSITYEGIKYDSVLIRYDEVTDVVVIKVQLEQIQLLSKKVQHFNIYHSDFIRLEKDSLTNNLVSSGFYNQLYKGKISLLQKEVKSLREVITSANEILHYADPKHYYYVQMDNRIYSIRNKNDFFNLLGDRKKEVQQFVNSNGLNFRRDKQNMLTRATAYYDSIKK